MFLVVSRLHSLLTPNCALCIGYYGMLSRLCIVYLLLWDALLTALCIGNYGMRSWLHCVLAIMGCSPDCALCIGYYGMRSRLCIVYWLSWDPLLTVHCVLAIMKSNCENNLFNWREFRERIIGTECADGTLCRHSDCLHVRFVGRVRCAGILSFVKHSN